MTDVLSHADQLTGYEFPPVSCTYTERDVALYALGVGAPADPLDQRELQFVYELSSEGFKALPTFAVLFPIKMIDSLLEGSIRGVTFNPMMIVHGEQYVEIAAPLPVRGTVTCRPRISAVYDKGSGALVVIDAPCFDEMQRQIAFNRSSMFIRGLGGWGGARGAAEETPQPTERAPDAVMRERTLPAQALLYRLSGDINPLHADPLMAALGGFDRPILHGLCSFGYAGRAVLKHFCGNDPARFRSMRARFTKPVFPGETLITEMWKENSAVLFRTTVEERGAVALANGVVELAE